MPAKTRRRVVAALEAITKVMPFPVVGYHRYDTPAELLLLNEIWALQSQMTNYFYPQQKLVSKVRVFRSYAAVAAQTSVSPR